MKKKASVSSLDLDMLKVGESVAYGFYSNVKFMGYDEDRKHVILKDKEGNTQKIFTSLFTKYARKI